MYSIYVRTYVLAALAKWEYLGTNYNNSVNYKSHNENSD